jgi:SAM-dependent methyltransferase
VLDAGCGAGRFAEVAAERGCRLVALDFSSAVDATAKTLERFENVDLVQASLLDPPFAAGFFDFAYCIGVVQHTPDPGQAIRGVLSCTKRGGRFAFTIYARRPWTKLNMKYLVRPVTSRMSEQTLRRAIESTMPLLFPLTDRLFRLRGIGKLARFIIPVATYVDDSHYSDEQRYHEAVLDTFDMLAPAYDLPMTWTEVRDILRDEGVEDWFFRTRVPINVVGVR